MKIQIKYTLIKDAVTQKVRDALFVASQRMREEAVDRTPASMQGPYSTGQLHQSIRLEQTGDLEYTLRVPRPYASYLEFGTGPKGQATGNTWTGKENNFPNDPYDDITYHSGEVIVTRHGGKLLDQPYIRHTEGMEAQPYLRPALMKGVQVFKEYLKKK